MKIAIVLGNRLNDDNSGTPLMNKRLDIAISLHNKQSIDKLIVCGGQANTKATITEAEYMQNYLIQHGIDSQSVILEDKSTTTKENALFACPIAAELNASEIYLVTTPEHMSRPFLNPLRLFKKAMGNKNIIPISEEIL